MPLGGMALFGGDEIGVALHSLCLRYLLNHKPSVLRRFGGETAAHHKQKRVAESTLRAMTLSRLQQERDVLHENWKTSLRSAFPCCNAT